MSVFEYTGDHSNRAKMITSQYQPTLGVVNNVIIVVEELWAFESSAGNQAKHWKDCDASASQNKDGCRRAFPV